MTSSRNVDHFMESIASSSTTRPNSPNLPVHNHIEYYLPGGDLFILVDNTLFRVHSYFFRRESQNWRNLLGTTTTGRTADAPLILNDEFPLRPPATPSLFANFLWVFYNPRYSIYEASSATWRQIQLYAIHWRMDQIQDLAYRHLEAIDSIDDYYFPHSSTEWNSLYIDPSEEAIRRHIEDDHGL